MDVRMIRGNSLVLAGRRDEWQASVESVEREDYVIDRHDASRTTI